jgi:hypothetical protein
LPELIGGFPGVMDLWRRRHELPRCVRACVSAKARLALAWVRFHQALDAP